MTRELDETVYILIRDNPIDYVTNVAENYGAEQNADVLSAMWNWFKRKIQNYMIYIATYAWREVRVVSHRDTNDGDGCRFIDHLIL